MKFSTTVVALASFGAVQAAHKPDCDAFCSEQATTCGTKAFADDAECKAACALMATTPGLPSTTDPLYNNAGTNTFFCREYHLSVATAGDQAAKDLHCLHIGGPNESDPPPCGTGECKQFCADYVTNCAGTANGFADATDCETKCAGWLPNKRGFYALAGNSFGCRRYHLDVAKSTTGIGSQEATTHCPHAGPNGGGVCIDNAANFCGLFAKACPSTLDPAVAGLAQYTDCATEFAAIPEGEPGATGGDSQACRQYHLDVAFNSFLPEPHCLHAAKNGGGVCVAPVATTAEPQTGSTPTRSFAGVAAAATLAVALLV